MISTWETCAAIVLFLITPKSVMQAIGKYVPGTQDHTRSQHEYAKRVRDLTADRVTQFSRVFLAKLRTNVRGYTASGQTNGGDESFHECRGGGQLCHML